MRDEHHGHGAPLLLGEQKVGDLRARVGVEIAGRLVRDQERGFGRQRASQRHALLLAARQFAGIVRHARAEADGAQLGLRPLEGVPMAREFQRHGDVFERRHVGNEMEGLEDDADMAAPKGGELVLAEALKRLARDLHLARVGPLQTGQNHQQRRFAGAGRADDADAFAARHVEVDSLENMHRAPALAERQMNLS